MASGRARWAGSARRRRIASCDHGPCRAAEMPLCSALDLARVDLRSIPAGARRRYGPHVLSRRAVLRGGLGAVLGGTLAGAAAGLPLAGCARRPEYRPGPLRIATGGAGGVYYAYGQ